MGSTQPRTLPRRGAAGPKRPRRRAERDQGTKDGSGGPRSPHARCRGRWQTGPVDDEELLSQAEQALTEIKINQGLSDRHASVLAALRIRLKGSAGKSLEEMLAAAGELRPGLEEELAKAESERKPSLDDLLSGRKPQPDSRS
jgi:hypothetical protein